MIVFCPKHDIIAETTYTNYKRSRTGLACCGRQQVSEKLKDRVFNQHTIQKMREAGFNRPDSTRGGGEARYWRKKNSYIQWRKDVFRPWNNECPITGNIL